MKELNDKFINQQGFLDHRTEFLFTFGKGREKEKSRV